MTKDIEIDESTGLPKLPEGMWWRVSEAIDADKPPGSGVIIGGKISHPRYFRKISIIKYDNYEYLKSIYLDKRTWWGKKKKVFSRHEKEQRSRVYSVYSINTPENVEVTKELIARYAVILYSQVHDKFSGDYPPNSLLTK